VESSLNEESRNPFEKVYGGVMLGERSFIKGVFQQFKDQKLRKAKISHRMMLNLNNL
jgi:hypothetical protein